MYTRGFENTQVMSLFRPLIFHISFISYVILHDSRWVETNSDRMLQHFCHTNILGSSSICTCQTLNVCFDFFFHFPWPQKESNNYSKFKIPHVQTNELPRTLVLKYETFCPLRMIFIPCKGIFQSARTYCVIYFCQITIKNIADKVVEEAKI